MQLNLRLSQIGLAIVSVLLVLELSILGALFYLLQQTELDAQRFERSSTILSCADGLIKTYYDCAVCLIYYLMTHKQELSFSYDKSAAEAPKYMDRLRDLTRDDPPSAEKVDSLAAYVSAATKMLNDYKKTIELDQLPDLKSLRKKVLPILTNIMHELKDFESNEKAKSSPDMGAQIRVYMKNIVFIGIIVNVIMALGLIYLFTKRITQRLNVLTDNAYRLASSAPLNPKLKGEDEIAHLDQVFHVMADALTLAAEKERLATEVIKASEEKIRSVIEHMPVGLIAIDDRGVIESVNPRTEEIFGYKNDELAGKHIGTLFESDKNSDPDTFIQVLHQKALGKVSELKGKKKNNDAFPTEISLSEFKAPEGRRFLANVLDVTDRHEVERLKREFVAIVSHDLRTPLTSVRGSLTLLSAGALGPLSGEAQQVVETAESEIERLTFLVNDLLDVAKIEAGKMEMRFDNISLEPVIRRSLASVGNFAAQHGVEIVARKTDARAVADSERLIQVMVNLLSNAVKFSPKGSRVEVTVDELPGWIEVRVKDSGRGVPPSHYESIFQRFQQVEKSDSTEKGGTGLGLPICKTIVEQHGGTIGVISELNKGSIFWFRLRAIAQPVS